MTALEEADGFKTPAGNIRHGAELKGQVVFDHPGSKTGRSLGSDSIEEKGIKDSHK